MTIGSPHPPTHPPFLFQIIAKTGLQRFKAPLNNQIIRLFVTHNLRPVILVCPLSLCVGSIDSNSVYPNLTPLRRCENRKTIHQLCSSLDRTADRPRQLRKQRVLGSKGARDTWGTGHRHGWVPHRSALSHFSSFSKTGIPQGELPLPQSLQRADAVQSSNQNRIPCQKTHPQVVQNEKQYQTVPVLFLKLPAKSCCPWSRGMTDMGRRYFKWGLVESWIRGQNSLPFLLVKSRSAGPEWEPELISPRDDLLRRLSRSCGHVARIHPFGISRFCAWHVI